MQRPTQDSKPHQYIKKAWNWVWTLVFTKSWFDLETNEQIAGMGLVVGGLVALTTIITLFVLKWTFDAAQQGADAAMRTMQLAYAARLVESKAGMPADGLVANTLATVSVTVKNIGSGTATEVTSIGDHEIIDRGGMPSFPLPGVTIRKLRITPGDDFEVTTNVPAEDLSDGRPNGPSKIAMLDDGRKVLLFYGVVLFYDGFQRQCMSFCSQFQPPLKPSGILLCETVPDCTRYNAWTKGDSEIASFSACFEGPLPTHKHQEYGPICEAQPVVPSPGPSLAGPTLQPRY